MAGAWTETMHRTGQRTRREDEECAEPVAERQAAFVYCLHAPADPAPPPSPLVPLLASRPARDLAPDIRDQPSYDMLLQRQSATDSGPAGSVLSDTAVK